MKNLLSVNAKSLLAALVTFLSAAATQLPGDGVLALTSQQWLTAAVAGVIALNAVWAVPNKGAAAAVKAFVPVTVQVPPATQVEDYLPTPVAPPTAYTGPIPPVTPTP